MDSSSIVTFSWLAGFVFLCLVFRYALAKKRYDVVDSAWGMTFIVIALTSFLLAEKSAVGLLLSGLVVVWGSRLSWHIFRRFRASKVEDARYTELRKKWRGNVAINAFFRIYLVQAVLAFLVCLPVVLANIHETENNNALIWLGLGMWLIGFAFEVIADKQLRAFVADSNNRGKLMNEGLWRYSRHPNYFGEITLWWGVFVMAYGATSIGWAIIGPLTITCLILFVSGIPPSERRFAGRPGWEAYKAKTSVLIPWRTKS